MQCQHICTAAAACTLTAFDDHAAAKAKCDGVTGAALDTNTACKAERVDGTGDTAKFDCGTDTVSSAVCAEAGDVRGEQREQGHVLQRRVLGVQRPCALGGRPGRVHMCCAMCRWRPRCVGAH